MVALRADAVVTSASLYKPGVMATVERAVSAGALGMDRTVTITQDELDFYGDDPASPAGTVLTVAQALDRMITVSDNSAAGALLTLVGYPAVNAEFARNGMAHTHLGTPPGTTASVPRRHAVTTAEDQATFFQRLIAGQVVSPTASEAMLTLLKAQTENDRLPVLLPAGTAMAHKTGELDPPDAVRNDAGIIFTPGGPVVCVVLTIDQQDVAQTDKAIAQEGRLVYDAVAGGGPPALDYTVGDGWCFSEANGRSGGDTGYTAADAAGIPFWSEFQRRGGAPAVGYPASDRFTWHGMTYQVMQKEVFHWQPQARTVAFLNVFDGLHDQGLDAWLDTQRQIPPRRDTSPDAGLSWSQVIARHQKLLAQDPAIRARYMADPSALDDYGLPMSVKDYGPVVVVRCQRAAFQHWKVAMPWAAAGAVTLVNGGDLAKEAGLFPAAGLAPGPPNAY